MNIRALIPAVALVIGASAAVTVDRAASSPLLPAPQPPSLTLIHMVTPHTGWGATRTDVVHTTDGGQRWQKVTPSIKLSGGSMPYTGLDPLNGASTWLAAPTARNQFGFTAITVFHTTDSGVTWQRGQTIHVGLFVGIDHLQFADRTHGWLVVTRDVGMSQQSFEIYRTADGGAHWARILREGPMYPSSSQTGLLPWCDCMQQYNFVSPTAGWAGACSCALTSGLVQLYRTDDGGRSWRSFPLILPRGYHPQATAIGAPVFFGSGIGILSVVLLNSSASGFFDEYHTVNGGRTWSGSTTIRVQLQDDPASFPDAMHAILQDGQTLYRTADGGHTWRTSHSSLARDSLMQLDLVTPTLGFALEGVGATDKTHLLRTGDGGKTWKLVQASLVARG